LEKAIRKIFVAIAVILVVFLSLIACIRISGTLYKKSLLERSDFPQIIAACVTLAHSATNDHMDWQLTDPALPPALRRLSLSGISGDTNRVTLWLSGGWERTVYFVTQSETNAKQWTIAVYSEHLGYRDLATITNN